MPLYDFADLPTDPQEAAAYELHLAGVILRGRQREVDAARAEYEPGHVWAWKRVLRAEKAHLVASRKWREALRRSEALRTARKVAA